MNILSRLRVSGYFSEVKKFPVSFDVLCESWFSVVVVVFVLFTFLCLCFIDWRYFFNVFFLLTQQIRERVKSMLHQAETLIAKSCYHGDGIRQWATAVEKRYKDFARRMKKYRTKLENKLGYTATDQEVCTFLVVWVFLHCK